MASTLTMVSVGGSQGSDTFSRFAQKREEQNGQLVGQQIINFNVNVSHELAKVREENASDYKIPAEQLFGRKIGRGGSDPREFLHIRQLDLLFCYKRQLFTEASNEQKASRVTVINVWNAAKIEPQFRTQQQYENQYRCLGYAAYDWTYRQGQQGGLACNVHGSKNFFYRGYKDRPLFVGDRMKWGLPSIFLEERERQRGMLVGDDIHPLEREAPIIEPMSYSDVHLFLQAEITKSFANMARDDYSWHKLQPGSNEYVDRERFAAIALRTLLQFNSFCTLAAFSAYTGVDLPTPGNGRVSTIGDTTGLFNANTVVERQSFPVVTQMRPSVDASGVLVPGAAPLTETQLLERGRRLEFWAAKLGCAPAAKGPAGQEATNLINAILGMTLRPLLMNKGLSNGTDILRLFPSSMRDEARLPVTGSRAERRPDSSKVCCVWGFPSLTQKSLRRSRASWWICRAVPSAMRSTRWARPSSISKTSALVCHSTTLWQVIWVMKCTSKVVYLYCERA